MPCINRRCRFLTCKTCPCHMEVATATIFIGQISIVTTVRNKRYNVLYFFRVRSRNMIVYLTRFFSHNFLICILWSKHISLFFFTQFIRKRRQIRKSHFTGYDTIKCIGIEEFILTILHSNKHYSLAILRHAIICGTEYLIFNRVPKLGKALNDVVLYLSVKQTNQSRNIFNDKCSRLNFFHQAYVT